MLPEIDFEKVRVVDGSKNLGFEELAVQLFRLKHGRECEFNRVGGKGGDSGVEAFWRKKRCGIVGLQAKYVKSLKGRKSQFDDSLKTALRNHPSLRTYIFVLPFDRHKKGARDDFRTWKNWVEGWQKYASEQYGKKCLTIQWCGEEEIRGMLLDQAARGLLEYYFGLHTFGPQELLREFQSAVDSLEDRYTQAINIETSAEERLEAFFGLETFRTKYRGLVNTLRKKVEDFLCCPPDGPCKLTVLSKTAEMRRRWRQLRTRLTENTNIPSFADTLDDLTGVGKLMDALRSEIDQQYHDATPHQRAGWGGNSRHSRVDRAEDMCGALWDLVEFVKCHIQWGRRRLLIGGEAGTGKSHLLAEVGHRLWKAGHPTVLLLGERFRTQDDPWEQTTKLLGFAGSPDTWLRSLNTLAEASQKIGVILVDAINESDCCKLWKTQIQTFAARVEDHPALRLVVTCRSDFTRYCLPDSLVRRSDESWAYFDHYGFDVDVVTAVEKYFKAYNVTSEVFPPIIEEFDLPLFLKIFCRTYEDQTVSACHLSLSRVLKDHKQHVAQGIAKILACDEYDVHRAVAIICDEMVSLGRKIIPMEGVRDKINSLVQAPDATKSLFNHLRSSGLIRQIGPDDGDPEVAFAFERLYDFHVAEKILDDYTHIDGVIDDLKKKGRLHAILTDERQSWWSRGLIGAFSVLCPEKFGVELIDLPIASSFETWKAFCDSIRWRRADSITDRTEEILRTHRADSIPFIVANFLDLAAVPDKRFNADYLHSELLKVGLAEREVQWTMPVSEETFYSQWCQLNRFVDWCNKVPSQRLSSEQARLSATLLSWCFSSTHVPFRNRATSAAIHVLCSHPDVVPVLLDSFGQNDDPYIRERVYAVAAGVAMRCSSPADVRKIAAKVFELFFNVKEVNPHILMRDYARCVMERALVIGALPEGVSSFAFRPPYTSVWPKITTTDDDIKKLADNDHGWALTSSMTLESEGNYGDFGRYEFGDTIHHFSRFKRNEPYPHDDSSLSCTFDARIAKRYLFDRVFELGWTPDGLGQQEKSHYDSRARPTVERVSKKYQWIALHEVLGYLADHYQPLRWSWTEEEKERTTEARDLSCRDFDPSVSPVTEAGSPLERVKVPTPWWCHVVSPLKDSSGASQWIFSDTVPEITRILRPPDAQDGVSWLTLCGYYEWSDYANVRQVDDQAPYRHATLRILSWIVPSNRRMRVLGALRAQHLYGMGLDAPTLSNCWIGEYPWAPCCTNSAGDFEGLPKCICQVTGSTLTGGFIGPSQFLAPAPQILSLLKASWAGQAADFAAVRSCATEVVSMNPAIREGRGPEACLVDKDAITKALIENRRSLVWVVLGERAILGGKAWCGSLEFTGVYWLDRSYIKGDITYSVKHPPRG